MMQPASTQCMNGCGRPATKLQCPVCQRNGVQGHLCGTDCYKANIKSHTAKYHVKVTPEGFPPGTYDPFASKKLSSWNGKHYTGALRAVYPIDEAHKVPRRVVPPHIKRPDYADKIDGDSEIEQRARNERVGKILNAEEIEGMRIVCRLAREVLDIAAAALRPGVTTLEIDAIVHEECVKRNSYPSPLGYYKFPRSVCTSVNEVICHGIPDARPLVEGDIINLDVTLYHEYNGQGYHGDLNATYPIGKVSQQNLDLIATARECLDESIRLCAPKFQYQDFGSTIEAIASKKGFSTNRKYCGHGINQLFHCMPNVPHYAGNKASGRLQVGQVFTIEPMICTGEQQDVHWPDNWTAVTKDGLPSAQFEETLLVTETGVEVLTAAPGWKLPEKGAQGWKNAGGGAKKKNKKKKKKAKKAAGEGEEVAKEGEEAEEEGEGEEEE